MRGILFLLVTGSATAYYWLQPPHKQIELTAAIQSVSRALAVKVFGVQLHSDILIVGFLVGLLVLMLLLLFTMNFFANYARSDLASEAIASYGDERYEAVNDLAASFHRSYVRNGLAGVISGMMVAGGIFSAIFGAPYHGLALFAVGAALLVATFMVAFEALLTLSQTTWVRVVKGAGRDGYGHHGPGHH